MGPDLDGAIGILGGQIAGAREYGDKEGIVRLSATRAFLIMYHNTDETENLLASAAFEALKAYPIFDEDHLVDARIALLGLPHRASEIRARLLVGLGLPERASAEFITTVNLAALLAGNTTDLLPTPGRRTDVAAAILSRNTNALRRLMNVDVTTVERYGFRLYRDPTQWYPIFSALIVAAAAKQGLALTLRLPKLPS